MTECPECDTQLRRGVCPSCGWKQPLEKGLNKKACQSCGWLFRLWVEVTQGDDGVRRCASCHMAYLEARAAADAAPGVPPSLKTLTVPLFRKMTTPLPRVPAGELDRPAAAWTPEERMQRGQDALAAYRRHLAGQGADVPF